MKKLATLLILLTIAIAVNAEIIVFRATNYAVQFGDDYEWKEWSDWKETGLLITVNIEDLIITIDNQYEDKFYVRKAGDEEIRYDDDGRYKVQQYEVIDQDNVLCYITWRTWDSEAIQLYVAYSNMRYVYQCKKIG